MSVFYNNNLGISHIAYDDDVLLLSRKKHSLIANFDLLSATLSTVGLSVNATKCEFCAWEYSTSPNAIHQKCNESILYKQIWAIFLHIRGGIAGLHAKCISYNYPTYYEQKIVF